MPTLARIVVALSVAFLATHARPPPVAPDSYETWGVPHRNPETGLSGHNGLTIVAYPNHMAGILSSTAYAQERHRPYVVSLPADLRPKRSLKERKAALLTDATDFLPLEAATLPAKTIAMKREEPMLFMEMDNLLPLEAAALPGEVYTTKRKYSSVKVHACFLPKDGGECYGFQPSYFYDEGDNACKFFFYTGCGGNQNKFDTKEFCEKTCTH